MRFAERQKELIRSHVCGTERMAIPDQAVSLQSNYPEVAKKRWTLSRSGPRPRKDHLGTYYTSDPCCIIYIYLRASERFHTRVTTSIICPCVGPLLLLQIEDRGRTGHTR